MFLGHILDNILRRHHVHVWSRSTDSLLSPWNANRRTVEAEIELVFSSSTPTRRPDRRADPNVGHIQLSSGKFGTFVRASSIQEFVSSLGLDYGFDFIGLRTKLRFAIDARTWSWSVLIGVLVVGIRVGQFGFGQFEQQAVVVQVA